MPLVQRIGRTIGHSSESLLLIIGPADADGPGRRLKGAREDRGNRRRQAEETDEEDRRGRTARQHVPPAHSLTTHHADTRPAHLTTYDSRAYRRTDGSQGCP